MVDAFGEGDFNRCLSVVTCRFSISTAQPVSHFSADKTRFLQGLKSGAETSRLGTRGPSCTCLHGCMEVVVRPNAKGRGETEASIIVRINRGRPSVAFFLTAFVALGPEEVQL